MNDPLILKDLDSGIATLTFNRPDARNAMSPAMRDDLCGHLERIAADTSVRALVLRGAGGAFVAGGDLDVFAETLKLDRPERQDNFVARVRKSTTLIESLVHFPLPLIAVVEGDAAGAGISIALCADFVIANRSARFTFAHAHVGLALDLGLSYFLPKVVGNFQSRRLAMLGEKISGEEALKLGLVTWMVEDGQVNQHLEELQQRLLKMPISALKAIKTELVQSQIGQLGEQLEFEAQMVGQCAATGEFEQRIAKFTRPSKKAG